MKKNRRKIKESGCSWEKTRDRDGVRLIMRKVGSLGHSESKLQVKKLSLCIRLLCNGVSLNGKYHSPLLHFTPSRFPFPIPYLSAFSSFQTHCVDKSLLVHPFLLPIICPHHSSLSVFAVTASILPPSLTCSKSLPFTFDAVMVNSQQTKAAEIEFWMNLLLGFCHPLLV